MCWLEKNKRATFPWGWVKKLPNVEENMNHSFIRTFSLNCAVKVPGIEKSPGSPCDGVAFVARSF